MEAQHYYYYYYYFCLDFAHMHKCYNARVQRSRRGSEADRVARHILAAVSARNGLRRRRLEVIKEKKSCGTVGSD